MIRFVHVQPTRCSSLRHGDIVLTAQRDLGILMALELGPIRSRQGCGFRTLNMEKMRIRIQVQKSQIEVHASSNFFFQILTKILKIEAEQEDVGANLKNFVTFCWKESGIFSHNDG